MCVKERGGGGGGGGEIVSESHWPTITCEDLHCSSV